MATYSRSEMLDLIHQVLESNAYQARLDTIHRHYPNLKSEERYRDALLELFNETQEKSKSGLRAYAEAHRYDLVITQNDPGVWLRIELKYHFTYDFAFRVKNQLPSHADDLNTAASRKNDLGNILRDCLHRDDTEYLVDAFILIVQDRYHTSYPEHFAPLTGNKASYPVVRERGVAIHFLNEQVKFATNAGGRDRYNDMWQAPLYRMLETIHQKRKYQIRPTVSHTVRPSLDIPLTSHIFTLDFARPEFPLPDFKLIFSKT